MLQSRDEIGEGLVAELKAFADLIRPLDAAQLGAPTRCEGWTVGDVAAHFIGSMTDVVNGNLDGLGTPEVTAREVAERSGNTAAQLADEADAAAALAVQLLAVFDDAAWKEPAPGGFDGSLGQGVEALWFDGVVHGDDVRAALGRPSAQAIAGGLVTSISHVSFILEQQGWGPATIALDGVPEVVVGGGGEIVKGDPMAFVLAATGRADPTPLGLDPTVNIYRET